MRLYKSPEIKKWDNFTIEESKITSLELMERAASIASKAIICSVFFKKVLVLCGPGNNGGDGYVIARLLSDRKIDVSVLAPEKPKSEDCITNANKLPEDVTVINEVKLNDQYDLIVDALFGVGFSGETRAPYSQLIQKINKLETPIIAIDVPSGLNPDEVKQNNPLIIKANYTLTFEQSKRAFYFHENEVYLGKIREVSIGLAKNFEGNYWAELISPDLISFNRNSEFSHKGDKGRLLVIGGYEKMAGASILATKAAFRTGCGYVLNYCSEFTQNQLLGHCPETIVVDEYPEKYDAISIGMGLGKSAKSLELLKTTLKTEKPILLDADAINLLSENRSLINQIPRASILTPHVAELHRLLGKEFDNEEDRLNAQLSLSQELSIYILQKGKYSKITTPDGRIYINPTGNKGMAIAGSGDVLSGIIGSLLAQGHSAFQAVITGVYIHGMAADIYTFNNNQIGMLPSDYLEEIPEAIERVRS